MHKKVLAEQALYHGDVKMPVDWELNQEQFTSDILESKYTRNQFKFSKDHDRLNSYIIEHMNLKHKTSVCQIETWGNIYKPKEVTKLMLEADLMNLKSSPDFVLLYGVKVKDCVVHINYDDNRKKDNTWSIPLTDNQFIMFPSTNTYHIENNQNDSLNFIQVITYTLD